VNSSQQSFMKCFLACTYPRALSVYNPRQDNILRLRDGLLALVVVAAFIVSGS